MSRMLATLESYRHTAGKVMQWIENQGLTDPLDVTARHVRGYFFQLIDARRKDTTLPAPAKFDMPKLETKRLLVLTAEEFRQIVKVCNVRDKQGKRTGARLWGHNSPCFAGL